MESLDFTRTEGGIHIEGLPDAKDVIKLDGPKAKRAADLILHKQDLEFAHRCLENITKVSEYEIQQALWRSAITHFFKCFGNGERGQLDAKRIYKDEPDEALKNFKYFRALRRKHIVHDENAYGQALIGAAINDGSKDYKVEKIVVLGILAETLDQNNWSNLKLLIEKAYSWVEINFKSLCDKITRELESEDIQSLKARGSVVYSVPDVNEVYRSRARG